MPIKRRQESSSGIYHVTARGINKEHIFNQIRERSYFKEILKKYLNKYDVKIYAYCIMSNHIHLVIQSELQTLSLFMSRILAEYAEYYNYKHQRNGHVFQNRFGSECIENTRYLWNCIRYVHLNPVKAQVVNKSYSYAFSSIREYVNAKVDIIHESTKQLLENWFESLDEFKQFHKEKDCHVFLDIASDIEVQLHNAAFLILDSMVKEFDVNKTVEILEDKNLRNKYLENLKTSLNISKNKSQKLYNHVKDSIMIQ